MSKVTILGCGSSHGVPVIGCKCDVCKSDSPYNKRRRSSILIEKSGATILVDFGFDIKDQLLDVGVERLDAAILTHDHADHISGIDNLRIFKYLSGKPLPIHTDAVRANKVRERYAYMVDAQEIELIAHDSYDFVDISGVKTQFFLQNILKSILLVYELTILFILLDVREFYDDSIAYLSKIDIWVLDCLGYKSNYAHAGLEQVLQWNEQFRPQKIYLTNMRDEFDYLTSKELPSNVKPSYDGLEIALNS